MILFKTDNYRKSVRALHPKDQTLLAEQEKLLEVDIFDPRLHTKKLRGFSDDKVFSFRITRVYRGIFRLSEDGIVLFAIGHRKEIYRSL